MDRIPDAELKGYARKLVKDQVTCAGSMRVGCSTRYTSPENAERFVMMLLIAIREMCQERSKDADDVGARVHALRVAAGLEIDELADLLGIYPHHMAQLENNAYGSDAEELLKRTERVLAERTTGGDDDDKDT